MRHLTVTTGAVDRTKELTKHQRGESGTIFVQQLEDWGGDISLARLQGWAKEAANLEERNNLFEVERTLFVPFTGEEEGHVVAYDLIDWLLEESPSHELELTEIAKLAELGIVVRS